MTEELLVYAILLESGLTSNDEYNEYLDRTFMENPDNSLLFELEVCFKDINKIIHTIWDYFYNNESSFDYNRFGKFLTEKLEIIYNVMDIQPFSDKMYFIWRLLPDKMQENELFENLRYADELLLWTEEKQLREYYKKLFDFYKET